MGIPLVLDGDTSVSSKQRRMGLRIYLGFELESNRRNKRDKLVDIFESTRDLGNFELPSLISHQSSSIRKEGRRDGYLGLRILQASRMHPGQFEPMRLRAHIATSTM